MTSSPVVADSLRKVYEDEFVAVSGSSFTVEKGEVVGIIGPNGAGKTTTLKMLSGLIEPTSGSAKIVSIDSTEPSMRTHLGFLPEESPAYDAMTAQSYLRFFADLYNVPTDTAKKRISQTLDELELEYRDRPIGNMSKGMTRKVLIARSLINNPDVLVYDEPASGLDPYTTNYIIDYIDELASRGKSIVFSAHNLYHVESLCDRVLIMDEGEIVAQGTVGEIRDEHGTPNYDVILSDEMKNAEPRDDKYRVRVSSTDEVDRVKQQATEQDITVHDVYTTEPSLEEIFLSLVTVDKHDS